MTINYPNTIISRLKRENVWPRAIVNFIVLNIVYFIHNVIENRDKAGLLFGSLVDQFYFILYYGIVISLITGLMYAAKIRSSLSIVTQYILGSSVILVFVYIADVPFIIFNLKMDLIFYILEFCFYIWISVVLVQHYIIGKKRYLMVLGVILSFYFTYLLRLSGLLISYIRNILS